jgi:tyrosine-specific transport protein
VGLALVEDIELSLESVKSKLTEKAKRCVCAAIAVVPSLVVAVFVPNAFVKVLSFAGMILSVIAIFLPTFLFFKIKKPIQFALLKRKEWIWACMIFGSIIVACEVASILLA